MANIIRVILFGDNQISCKQVEDMLDNWYELLDCRCIDIITRNINGKEFDIVCDDEGLLKDEPQLTACWNDGIPALFGKLAICHHDDYGELVGLSDEDIITITRAVYDTAVGPVIVLDYDNPLEEEEPLD